MRLAPDVIKLDRSLVAGVAGDPVKAALIESFVRYAREIDADVCAEGVEELDDLARLADLDVAYGQGYGLSRPAQPWAGLAEQATSTCRVAFTASLAEHAATGSADHGLELLLARLSVATDVSAIEALTRPIAGELGADDVRLVPAGTELAAPGVDQALVGDPATDAATAEHILALGFRSRLRVPVRSRAATLAVMEAYSIAERP